MNFLFVMEVMDESVLKVENCEILHDLKTFGVFVLLANMVDIHYILQSGLQQGLFVQLQSACAIVHYKTGDNILYEGKE